MKPEHREEARRHLAEIVAAWKKLRLVEPGTSEHHQAAADLRACGVYLEVRADWHLAAAEPLSQQYRIRLAGPSHGPGYYVVGWAGIDRRPRTADLQVGVEDSICGTQGALRVRRWSPQEDALLALAELFLEPSEQVEEEEAACKAAPRAVGGDPDGENEEARK